MHYSFIHHQLWIHQQREGKAGVWSVRVKSVIAEDTRYIFHLAVWPPSFLTCSLRFQNIWDNQNKEHNLHTLLHPPRIDGSAVIGATFSRVVLGFFFFFFWETAAFCFLGASCSVSKSLLPACGSAEMKWWSVYPPHAHWPQTNTQTLTALFVRMAYWLNSLNVDLLVCSEKTLNLSRKSGLQSKTLRETLS